MTGTCARHGRPLLHERRSCQGCETEKRNARNAAKRQRAYAEAGAPSKIDRLAFPVGAIRPDAAPSPVHETAPDHETVPSGTTARPVVASAATGPDDFEIVEDPPAAPSAQDPAAAESWRNAAAGAVRTIAILCDVHVPDHDRPAWGAVLAWLAAHPVDEVILAGDFLELASCSLHGDALVAGLEADFAAGRKAIAELRAAAPAATVAYLAGNHETRLDRFLRARAPTLLGSLSVAAGLDLDRQGVTYHDEGVVLSRGTLDVIHGHTAFGKFPPILHAKRVAELYGRQGRTVVYGHTHRPQSFARSGHAGVSRAVGFGCLRTLAPGWLHGHPAGWEHGFGVAYVRPSGRADVYAVPIHAGAIAWGGRLYVAR